MTMIVSVFIRHYKAFNGINHIPLFINNNFSVFFGSNGIGKSSILEALDSYFNNRNWNINKFAKSHGFTEINRPYIVPVFIIKKESLPDNNSKLKEKMKKLSDAFWNINRTDIKGGFSSEGDVIKFFDFRNNTLLSFFSQNDYYLLLVGKSHSITNDKIDFGPFHFQEQFLHLIGINHESINENTDLIKNSREVIDNMIQEEYLSVLRYIQGKYNYIYIPSDIDVQNYTKLENQDMQKLMHKDIQDEIKNAITQKRLDDINQSLKEFVDSISDKLIDYEYRKPTEGISTIGMPDLVAKIIETYFSTRVLSKKQGDKFIPVNDLSSGEKRKALVDLAFAFLNEKEKHEKEIILAIDEPEVSLHISACFDQFEKLRKIADNSHNIIITTHWYGFLPIVNSGYAHNVFIKNDKINFNTYSLEKYQEEIILTKRHEAGKLPFDIYLKSTNDLVQSIIASVRKTPPYNYILCEGSSDSIYLRFYLKKYIENNNLRILPLGGCSEVIKIIKNIELISTDKNSEIKGKILGLIDTDIQFNKPEINENNNLVLRRLLYDKKENDVTLAGPKDITVVETQIEHVLDPELFLETIVKYYSNEKISNIIKKETYNENAKCSYNIIDFTENQKDIFKEFFHKNIYIKNEFAANYVSSASKYPGKIIPKTFRDIIDMFNFNDMDLEKINISNLKEPNRKVIILRPKR
jgi:predicted ATP-dependent endonuclease of OLD family